EACRPAAWADKQCVEVSTVRLTPEKSEQRIIGEEGHRTFTKGLRDEPGAVFQALEMIGRNHPGGGLEAFGEIRGRLQAGCRFEDAAAAVQGEDPGSGGPIRGAPGERMGRIDAQLEDRPGNLLLALLAE